jgi:alpha-mannosidase
VENTASDHRLRVAFPTDISSDTAYAGQPYDVVERPVQPENVNVLEDWDLEAYVGYHPMNDFCGISDGIHGASAAGDGIMEYEVLPMRRTLCLTLIRATDRLLTGVLETGSKFRLSSAQLKGTGEFRYAFIPHSGGYVNVLDEVEHFRHPLRSVQKDFLEAESMPDYVPEDAVLPMSAGFVKVSGGGVLTSIKPSEEGGRVIVRLFNPTDRILELAVSVDNIYQLIDAQSVKLDETPIQSLPVEDNRIDLIVQPKKIITLSLNTAIKREGQ